MKEASWIHLDEKQNTIYVNLNSEGGRIIKMAPGEEPQPVENELGLVASPMMKPVQYIPSTSEAEGFARLKALLMDTFPAEQHDQYLMLSWLISLFLGGYFRDRGILQIMGASAIGKTKTMEREAFLFYGDIGSLITARATQGARYHLWDGAPLLLLDNIENRDLIPESELVHANLDTMLLSTSVGRGGVFKDGKHVSREINTMCMVTSIEPFPGKYPELINRTFTVQAKSALKQRAYLHEETMQMIAGFRSRMLSDIFRLISLKVLPRLVSGNAFWKEFIDQRYPGHSKERLNDHLAVMALILEALLEYLPCSPIANVPEKLQAVAILDPWVESFQEEA